MKKVRVVGAGFTGATIARSLVDQDPDVLVEILEKRSHYGGNAWDYFDSASGTRIHQYGPHLFHTDNQQAFDFLSRFTGWVRYEHQVRALVGEQFVPFPPNQETLSHLGIGAGMSMDVGQIDDIRKRLVEIFIRPYTVKMWGRAMEDVDPKVINRVASETRLYTYDTNYFNDLQQCLPENGYTALFSSMLNHERIKLIVGADATKWGGESDHIFWTASIDEFPSVYTVGFDKLPYRSIFFHEIRVPVPSVLPTATVNFTDDGPYTRMTEWSKLPGHRQRFRGKSVITLEEPCDPRDNHDEKYYPVVDDASRELYKRYVEKLAEHHPSVTFCGRLGGFVYINMDQAVSHALGVVRKHLRKE